MRRMWGWHKFCPTVLSKHWKCHWMQPVPTVVKFDGVSRVDLLFCSWFIWHFQCYIRGIAHPVALPGPSPQSHPANSEGNISRRTDFAHCRLRGGKTCLPRMSLLSTWQITRASWCVTSSQLIHSTITRHGSWYECTEKVDRCNSWKFYLLQY